MEAKADSAREVVNLWSADRTDSGSQPFGGREQGVKFMWFEEKNM